jgi:transposase-like protein
MTTSKNGVSAKSLKRILGFGSYQTAWSMLHRYGSAMVRLGRDRLSGDVEVDETMIGGAKSGQRGRGAAGKVLVAVAVEKVQPTGFGRCRLKVLANAESETLRSFLLDHVAPASVLLTDGFSPYARATGANFTHKAAAIKGSGKKTHDLLPGVHPGGGVPEALPTRHPPGLGPGGPHAGVSGRVHVPVQQAPIESKEDAVLPAAPTSGRDRSRPVLRTRGESQAPAGWRRTSPCPPARRTAPPSLRVEVSLSLRPLR